MSEQKICRNCTHYDSFNAWCIRGKREVGVNLVHGGPVYEYKVCGSARAERTSWLPWSCGSKGRYFERKYAAYREGA